MFDIQSTQSTYDYCDILIRLIRIYARDVFKVEEALWYHNTHFKQHSKELAAAVRGESKGRTHA